MNALYFELRQPLHISATSAGNSQADGKIFVHFYPSGHIIIHLAIALKPYPQGNLHELKRYVVETRPWRLDNRWMWTSRLGNGSLSETVNHVRKRLFTSLFIDGGEHLHDGQWHTTMKLVTREHAEDVAARFFKGQYGTFRLHDSEPGYKHRAENPDQLPTYVDHEFILSSKQGVIFILSPSRNRKSALRLFWRIFTLREFVMLKHCVYGQYSDHLREEIPNLKEYRLSTLRKLKKEDLRRLSVYDRQMPRYFQALDRHIRKAKPFYRKMYSSLSSGTGFDERRADVMRLVTTWESEVEQWEHSAVVLWRRLISPIRALLAGSR